MIPGGQSVVDECWALLAVVLIVFACRIASRRILLGSFKKLQIDDYLMTLNIAMFVVTIVSIYLQCIWGNNYVTADDVVGWTPGQYHDAIQGAKWGVAMETNKITCVWGCKACLLILYASMTKGLPKYHRAVMLVAVYVAAGYIIVMACFFTAWCKPFHAYYDVIPLPESQSQCMTYRSHMILDACFNITGDAIMLCLPIPLVIQARVPLKRKLTLVAVFSLGSLVILCAILNRITNFTAPYGSLIYLNWYAGETATAVVVANVPHLWPLISRVFGLGAFKQVSDGPNGSNQYPLRSQRNGPRMSSHRREKFDIDGYVETGSEERIATNGDKDGQWGYAKNSDTTQSSDDIELGNGYMTTSVLGGSKGNVNVEQKETSAWDADRTDQEKQGHIVKTVRIDQYASESP